jgi:hypothetical protein
MGDRERHNDSGEKVWVESAQWDGTAAAAGWRGRGGKRAQRKGAIEATTSMRRYMCGKGVKET